MENPIVYKTAYHKVVAVNNLKFEVWSNEPLELVAIYYSREDAVRYCDGFLSAGENNG